MTWTILILIGAALLAVVRIIVAVRRHRAQPQDDWDARLVQNLRAAGGNAFTPYEVDFFFNLPDEAACAALRGVLEPEGFAIDSRIMGGEAASGYSLHARKPVRVSITQMQEYSQRFRALAEQHGGHYDGWMTDPGGK
ncbi:MAG TPA: ribonuclease E inhibitor RraB [Steroidobacteraceae bacterium]|nr:ribonuclease E inhibitor RraB [Steroidobacteraceae bacterium]